MAKEFSTKLEQYYEFCSKAEDTLDKLGEQLDQVCSRRVTVDPISITVTLERHKAYLNQVEDQYSLIDLCHSVRNIKYSVKLLFIIFFTQKLLEIGRTFHLRRHPAPLGRTEDKPYRPRFVTNA